MTDTDILDEVVAESPEVLREQALRRIRKRRDFKTHLFIYAIVNACLWGIWAATGAGFPWPVFPMLAWGIGVGANAWDVYLRPPITEREVQDEMQRLREQR
jgi:hypothetical protein